MIPVVSIVGRSDSGKTTLIEKLVPLLKERGLRVGTIKHNPHGFEVDWPGKDSWRHKRAGADVTIISCPNKLAMIKDTDHDWSLDELVHLLNDCDIILAEGYKRDRMPKIEVLRYQGIEPSPLCGRSDNLIAIVSEVNIDIGVPVFHPDNVEKLVSFLTNYFSLL